MGFVVTYQCDACDMSLWIPIGGLRVSSLGLYSDSRFPGRCILALNSHYESLEDMPAALAADFMADLQEAARAVKSATRCARVNVAILGNKIPHVHAHLIPRYPWFEPKPDESPWADPRPRTELIDIEDYHLSTLIRENLPSGGVM